MIASIGHRSERAAQGLEARATGMRDLYLQAALPQLPRLLGAIDRNPHRATYGCLDRQFWHYRTSSFPSEMYQEGALPLALAFVHDLPGNRWHGERRVRELAIAALRFSARSCHADGSCDDYYPYERALGAAVFSLNAASQAYELLVLDDRATRAWFRKRSDWLLNNDESGRLANHQALAALGLLRVSSILQCDEYRHAAVDRLQRVVEWQSPEGWFAEYEGADPGYQTVTVDCLVQCRRLLADSAWLDEPLRKGVEFARLFLHPDDSYGGEYGSRGTYHFYPRGFESLAAELPAAADLADGFLRSLAAGKQAHFDDDRMFAHRMGNLIEAYLDWSPRRAADDSEPEAPTSQYLSHAKIAVVRGDDATTIVSAARGGVFKHFRGDRPYTDAGLIVELADGAAAVSQSHDLSRSTVWRDDSSLTVTAPLHATKFETVTPFKQAVLHVGMLCVGRFSRTFVRKLLQRRLITGRKECGVRLTRTFEWQADDDSPAEDKTIGDSDSFAANRLRVTDLIELTLPRVAVKRLHFGVDHQAAYVAACGAYQDSVLQPWTDLTPFVEQLNANRQIKFVRWL